VTAIATAILWVVIGATAVPMVAFWVAIFFGFPLTFVMIHGACTKLKTWHED
jgi:hypothetical protein